MSDRRRTGPAAVLDGLTWESDGRRIVAINELSVGHGERLVIFGPNGSGKSTILRLVAGVLGDRPGDNVTYLPQRPYMFRGSGRRNLRLGLDAAEAEEAERLAGRLGIGDLLGRPAARLSGGERQRLALARALAKDRPIVALDEPMAAVDVKDRDGVVAVIGDAIGSRAALLVTHDETVAAAFGDRVAVVVAGIVRQVGSTQDVFVSPDSEDVASALGHHNVLLGTVRGNDGPLVQVSCDGLLVWALGAQAAGSEVRVMFGAEAVTLHSMRGSESAIHASASARNRWLGTVRDIRRSSRLVEVIADVGQPVAAIITIGSMDAMGLAVDDKVVLSVKATAASAITAAKQ